MKLYSKGRMQNGLSQDNEIGFRREQVAQYSGENEYIDKE
jgi:hypothetical protein